MGGGEESGRSRGELGRSRSGNSVEEREGENASAFFDTRGEREQGGKGTKLRFTTLPIIRTNIFKDREHRQNRKHTTRLYRTLHSYHFSLLVSTARTPAVVAFLS